MRPDKDTYFLQMAVLVATRSTCARRAVGAVLVDAKGRVLSTGYNGVPARMPHCNSGRPEDLCPGASAPSGTCLDQCMAIHAEMNAVIQCRDLDKVATAYITVSPCIQCTKVLLNTGCQRLVFSTEYVQPEAKALWLKSGRVYTLHQGE